MKIDFSKTISKQSTKSEAGWIILLSALFVLVFNKIFLGKSMLSHDSIRWYGIWHFFADSLLNGQFPYWDPYDFSGQPFYYNLGILRIFEPITIGFIMLHKLFKVSLLTLYHLEYMTRIWLVAVGVYLCFRQTSKYVISNVVVFWAFLFSSFTITCLRQNGVLYTFFWAPWVIYFLLRLLKNFSLYNLIGLSFFVGLSLSSYQGVYILTYLFIFILSLLINQRPYLISLFKKNASFMRISLSVIIVIILSLPLFTVVIEQGKIIPTARLDDKADIIEGIRLTFASVEKAGTHSNFADFLELIFPVAVRGYFWGWFPMPGFALSECFLYIGMLPFLLSLVGIFSSRSRFQKNFLFVLIVTGLLMLGPKGIVYTLLYLLFYPLTFARHMHLFSGFFIFTLFYFVGQGLDITLDKFSLRFNKV